MPPGGDAASEGLSGRLPPLEITGPPEGKYLVEGEYLVTVSRLPSSDVRSRRASGRSRKSGKSVRISSLSSDPGRSASCSSDGSDEEKKKRKDRKFGLIKKLRSSFKKDKKPEKYQERRTIDIQVMEGEQDGPTPVYILGEGDPVEMGSWQDNPLSSSQISKSSSSRTQKKAVSESPTPSRCVEEISEMIEDMKNNYRDSLALSVSTSTISGKQEPLYHLLIGDPAEPQKEESCEENASSSSSSSTVSPHGEYKLDDFDDTDVDTKLLKRLSMDNMDPLDLEENDLNQLGTVTLHEYANGPQKTKINVDIIMLPMEDDKDSMSEMTESVIYDKVRRVERYFSSRFDIPKS